MFNRLKESNSVAPVEEMEGARRATRISSTGALTNSAAGSDPEVLERPQRRRFTAKYKLQVLEQADACTAPGEIGALLRREGLYSSHLSSWRRLRKSGALAGLTPRKRGRKVDPAKQQIRRIAELERENQRLRERLAQAETIIDVQKKVSSLLGIAPSQPPTDVSD
jgi:transposase-like protein